MRQIYTVDAKQVVPSAAHPEGVFQNVSGYPKTFDSRSYNATTENPDGDAERAFIVAKADFLAEWSALLVSDSARTMWAVMLTRADGRQMMSETWGAFPDVTPTTVEE
jgi:hypothetical protein